MATEEAALVVTRRTIERAPDHDLGSAVGGLQLFPDRDLTDHHGPIFRRLCDRDDLQGTNVIEGPWAVIEWMCKNYLNVAMSIHPVLQLSNEFCD